VLLPFTLTRLKLDPAVASSPLITSMMDAIGLFIYFGIATAVLTLT
jgi:magnesium transporter